jgi:peptide/nickel transport system permease protein
MELRSIRPVEEILGPSHGQLLRRRIFGHRGLMIGGVVLAVIILFALLAPVLSPHDPYAQSLITRLSKPFWQAEGKWTHPLGTDHVGRDYLSRLLYGAQISLLIGFCVALISGVIGTALGVVAGYFGGRVDMVITFIITLRLSIPFVLVAVAVVGIVGGSLKVVIIVLGLLLWNRYAVVMRSATQQIRHQDWWWWPRWRWPTPSCWRRPSLSWGWGCSRPRLPGGSWSRRGKTFFSSSRG